MSGKQCHSLFRKSCVTRTFNYPHPGHPAVDIKCDTGSVGVVALADAEVVDACDGQGVGIQHWSTTKCGQGHNFVKIKYNINGTPLYVFYYHLAQGSVRAAKGEHKKKGEKVGMSGSTGNSDGIHLDVTAQKNERPEYGGKYDPESVVNFTVVTGLDGWDACYISKHRVGQYDE